MSNNRYSVKAWEVYNALPQNVKKEHDAQEKKSFLWHLADQIEEHDLIGLGGGAIVSYLVSMNRNDNHQEALEDAGIGALAGVTAIRGVKAIFHKVKEWL